MRPRLIFPRLRCLLFLLLAALGQPAFAADWADSGRLLATGGVSELEGAGGGGLVPWALITGYGTRDSVGGNVHVTGAYLSDFSFGSTGVAMGINDRLELSYAHQWFDTRAAGGRLGIGNGYTIGQDIAGVKLRVLGNAVYDQDSWLPELAVGLQVKSNSARAVLRAIGAAQADGIDYYVAATKLLLSQSLLVDATVRLTRANQFGLLGFGGDRNDDYRPEFEGSAAYLVTRRLVLGGEVRTKPDNLRFAHEGPAFDVFGAYFFNKTLSATLAYLNLGDVARQGTQNGAYLSLQVGF